jgi:hypothetical protein
MSSDYMELREHLEIGDIKNRIESLRKSIPQVEPGQDPDLVLLDPEQLTDYEELQRLENIEHELSWCWNEAGKTLIRDDCFEAYAQEQAIDIGEVQRRSLAFDCIDWTKYVTAMQQDWKQIEIEDQTYWVRQ